MNCEDIKNAMQIEKGYVPQITRFLFLVET